MSRFSEDQDVERELVAAMNDFVDSTPVPTYDPSALIAARRGRRGPQLWALAAVVIAVAAVGTGVAVVSGGSSPRPTPPAAPSRTSASHAPSASASADPSPLPYVDPAQAQDAATRTVTVAAMMYENSATRGKVKLDTVAALFASPAVFTHAWGSGGLGVTCGQVADGALNGGIAPILYHGTHRLTRHPQFVFDADTSKVTGVTCGSASTGPGDAIMVDVYGGVVSGGKSGDGLLGPDVTSATCGHDQAKTWYADDPGSGTLTEGWTVRVDGYGPINAGIDPNKRLLFSVTCPK
ncbi:hypothetical protein [Streptacidiphilus sp. PAMC 29251]